jgi:hypothetical protein
LHDQSQELTGLIEKREEEVGNLRHESIGREKKVEKNNHFELL